jgi:molecular chaperone DnaK
MVQDAEASKDADAARRIMIDLKNEADQATYNTEKQIQEHSAKIPQNIKDQINGDITALNEAITTEEVEKIKEALERLKNSSMEIGKAIYAQTDSSTDSTDSSEPPKDEGEEKKDEEKKDEEKK